MAITNHERVGKALDLLKTGLAPFVQREIKDAESPKVRCLEAAVNMVDDPVLADKPISEWDAAGLLKLMWETWKRGLSEHPWARRARFRR